MAGFWRGQVSRAAMSFASPVTSDEKSDRSCIATMIAMPLDQLVEKQVRLRTEVSAGDGAASSNQHINRLDTEIASTEKAIAEAQSLQVAPRIRCPPRCNSCSNLHMIRTPVSRRRRKATVLDAQFAPIEEKYAQAMKD